MSPQMPCRVAPSALYGGSYAVQDSRGQTLDVCRTRSGAGYAAQLLNSGLASVQPHAIVGCRIVPVPPRSREACIDASGRRI